MIEFHKQYLTLRKLGDKIDERQKLLTQSNGHAASRVAAYSSILVDLGIEKPEDRKNIIAAQIGVIFPKDLV